MSHLLTPTLNHGDPRNQKQRNLHFYQTVHQHHHPKMAIPWWTRAQDTLGQHEALSQDNSGNTSDPRGNQWDKDSTQTTSISFYYYGSREFCPVPSAIFGKKEKCVNSLTEDTFVPWKRNCRLTQDLSQLQLNSSERDQHKPQVPEIALFSKVIFSLHHCGQGPIIDQ